MQDNVFAPGKWLMSTEAPRTMKRNWNIALADLVTMNSKEIQESYRVQRWNRYRCNHGVNIRAEIGDSSSRVFVPCVPATRTFTGLPFVLVVVPLRLCGCYYQTKYRDISQTPGQLQLRPGRLRASFEDTKANSEERASSVRFIPQETSLRHRNVV